MQIPAEMLNKSKLWGKTINIQIQCSQSWFLSPAQQKRVQYPVCTKVSKDAGTQGLQVGRSFSPGCFESG